MTQDSWNTLVGITVGLSFPLAVIAFILGLAFIIWVVYTVFRVSRPVWFILFAILKVFIAITFWLFFLSGLCWLFGFDGPIHFFSDIYAAIPGKVYAFLTK